MLFKNITNILNKMENIFVASTNLIAIKPILTAYVKGSQQLQEQSLDILFVHHLYHIFLKIINME